MKKISDSLYWIIPMIILLTGYFLFSEDNEVKNKNQSEVIKKNKLVDFNERFVTYEKFKKNNEEILLDLETGCLYYRKYGKEFSPLVKNKQEFDCSENYKTEYKNRKEEK